MNLSLFVTALLAQSFSAAIPEIAALPPFLKSMAILAGVSFIAYVLLFLVLPPILRSFQSDTAIAALTLSRKPILLIILLAGLKLALPALELAAAAGWIQTSLNVLIVAIATYWLSTLLTQVIIYYLKGYAERSEAMWDDVLLPILETILPIIVYIIGGSVLLEQVGVDIAGLWVAIGGATFVIGFAFKDSLANFLSGLVLLVDTPFQFGDVVMLSKGERAVIKKIGLRVTHLYVINHHTDMYLPNATFEKEAIVNMTRPTPHYYEQLEILTLSTADPSQVVELMENVILAHPDTTGEIERKLAQIETFYGLSKPGIHAEEKRKTGALRLLAEQRVNERLGEIEAAFDVLSSQIAEFENRGLDENEIGIVQRQYLDICQQIGLVPMGRLIQNRKKTPLLDEEKPDQTDSQSLIALVRNWYACWLKDPDLLREDLDLLPQEWEQKIDFLKRKANRLFRRTNTLSIDETRLDDAVQKMANWLREQFKQSRVDWQDPKIWVNGIKLVGSAAMDPQKNYVIKFFVDDIKLEHGERGNRVKSELYRELMWHLRQSYLAK